jgi:hypothetical protein
MSADESIGIVTVFDFVGSAIRTTGGVSNVFDSVIGSFDTGLIADRLTKTTAKIPQIATAETAPMTARTTQGDR